MGRKSYNTAVITIIAGGGLFGSLARSPSFQAYRIFDIVGLVLVGVCFGYAGALLAEIRRGAVDKR